MASHNDLLRLSSATEGPLVSIYLPTSPSGAETEDAALHLKVLRTKAHEALLARGLRDQDATEFLNPLVALEADRHWWQNQHQGLAIFLGPEGIETLSLEETVEPLWFVDDTFELIPLLPHVTSEGSFVLLKLSQESVTLFEGTHQGLEEVEVFAMPEGIDGVLTEDDYQNPAYAAPPARPNLGHQTMSHAQVYGQAPPEWKKTLRERYVEQISRALEGRLTNHSAPTVLVADEELAGLMGARVNFTHIDTTHPDSMTTAELHALAWALVSGDLDQQRRTDIADFERVLGQGGLVTTDLSSTVVAANEGRVDTVLVSTTVGNSQISSLLGLVLKQGGRVIYAPELSDSLPEGAGAILRYA